MYRYMQNWKMENAVHGLLEQIINLPTSQVEMFTICFFPRWRKGRSGVANYVERNSHCWRSESHFMFMLNQWNESFVWTYLSWCLSWFHQSWIWLLEDIWSVNKLRSDQCRYEFLSVDHQMRFSLCWLHLCPCRESLVRFSYDWFTGVWAGFWGRLQTSCSEIECHERSHNGGARQLVSTVTSLSCAVQRFVPPLLF